MILTKLNKADQKNNERGFTLGEWCVAKGISFYVVTASGTDEVKGYSNGLTICTGDETTLKTIVRANPGLHAPEGRDYSWKMVVGNNSSQGAVHKRNDN